MIRFFNSVVSQNIQGFPNILKAKNNLKRFFFNIHFINPDIIMLQEVFREKWLLFVKKELTDYTPFYCKTSFLIEGGLVILIKTCKIEELLDLGYQFELSYSDFKKQGVVNSAQIVSHVSSKGFLTLNIFHKNDSYCLINTHTTSSFNRKNKRFNKKLFVLLAQLNELSEYVGSIEKTKILLAGDFNYDLIKYTDYFLNFDIFPNGDRITYPKNNSRIDFILTQNLGDFKVKILNSYKLRISDHNGVILL
ncbi:MAG: endonuclease/exonuclease/phosphatase family protein [Patescibacteria group bacterium]